MYISNNGEVYDDEEIVGYDVYYYNSIYDRDGEEYVYEDEYDNLAIALEDKLQIRSVSISI
jgi:hypothetical protein